MRRFYEVEVQDTLAIRIFLTIFTTILPFACGYFFALTRLIWFLLFAMVPLFFEIERREGKVRVYV